MVEVSVIIPAYNAETTIKDTLRAVLNQDFSRERYEVIVVDDGSTDRTAEVVREFEEVKLISIPRSGPGKARNVGAKAARGKFLLFTDADCVPTKDWIDEMIAPLLKDKEVVGVGGAYKTLNKESTIARFVGYEIERRHEKLAKLKYIDFVGTFSAAYRKDIFLKFGGFDESFPMASGEDIEFSFRVVRAGHKLVFNRRARVFHRHPDSLFKFLKQQFWRGFWRVKLYKRHREKILRHAYTPKLLFLEILLLGMAILAFLLSILGVLFPIHLHLFAIYGLLLARQFFYFVKKDAIVGLFSLFLIPLRDFSIGLGILFGLFKSLKGSHV
jgi:cellulose synthase/poly-beta-1,6-N-acetylglucosamine synthase-like glycosyltransferase